MRAVFFSSVTLGAVVLWGAPHASVMAQANSPARSPNSTATTNGAFSSNVNTAGPIAPDKAHPLDLNAASGAELNALPGISAERSDAIVAGRPYTSTDDLVNRNILQKVEYDRIKSLINIKNH